QRDLAIQYHSSPRQPSFSALRAASRSRGPANVRPAGLAAFPVPGGPLPLWLVCFGGLAPRLPLFLLSHETRVRWQNAMRQERWVMGGLGWRKGLGLGFPAAHPPNQKAKRGMEGLAATGRKGIPESVGTHPTPAGGKNGLRGSSTPSRPK